MNEVAMKKHEIFNKLGALSGQELGSVADFIDFMNYKKKQTIKKKIIKLQGILKGYAVDSMDVTEFRQQSWKHLEEEFKDE
jgi:hypothetical protein